MQNKSKTGEATGEAEEKGPGIKLRVLVSHPTHQALRKKAFELNTTVSDMVRDLLRGAHPECFQGE